ncbi:MAG: penicillin-binding transpeptidase domain-containing protein [Eubacterium sp.]
MKMIAKRGIFLWILSALFIGGLVFLTVSVVQNGNEWAMKRFNSHIYTNGQLIGAGTIYDCNGDILAETVDGNRVYSDDKTTRESTLHVIGDPTNSISTGVQATFRSDLTGYNIMYGVYNLERNGKGNDINLTVDSEICNLAYDQLDGRKGTVAVVNYKTGDLLCSVSSPSFDVNDIPSDLLTSDKYEGAYINRLLGAHYVPGSTFKIVTAICALENWDDALTRKWNCTGEYVPGTGVPITCEGHKVHGTLTLEEAFAKSCNCIFAQIAVELGSDKLMKTGKELGIGSSVTISGKIESFAGTFDGGDDGKDLLGRTGFGQGNTRIAPITMLRIVSAIANGGSVPSFNIIDSVTNQKGNSMDIELPENNTRLIDKEVCSDIADLMAYNGKNQYDDVIPESLNVCAKTGTAEIDENPDHNIAWFVGYMDDDEHPYAFVVVVENGSSGHYTAAPIAKKVLQAIVDKY